jgi:pimeloyl-ACP methyl ester carboxylesterase
MEFMKHFYHGLFGSPEDWKPIISQDEGVILHDLYQEKETILNQKTHSQDILIGYSMGGRIALEIARRNNFNLSHLVLLSAHPGLRGDEISDRKTWEDEVLQKMLHLNVVDFIKFWSSLPLFNSSQMNQNLDEKKLRESASLFDYFRLSQTTFTSSIFSEFKNKIIWIIGNKDLKYKELVKQRISPEGIEVFYMETDHRVLSAPQKIREILKIKGIA